MHEKLTEDFFAIDFDKLDAETKFDVCEAWYLFARDYHSGQDSELYAVLSRLAENFRPACNLEPDKLTEQGKEIYDALVERENNRLVGK